MVDLNLDVELQLKGLQRFKGGAREAEGALKKLGAAGRSYGRDAGGRFTSGGGSYTDAAGRVRDARGRFVGGGGGGGGASGEDDFGKQVAKVGRGMKNAGQSLSLFGAGTGYALSRMVQPALDYERAIVDTIAVTGDAANNLGNEEKLRKLSASFVDLGANATDTAKAMEFLALAGYSTQQQMQAMPNVLFAARAGSEDVIKTAGYLSDVATGFGFGADQFARVSDVMTYVNNETLTTLANTAEAMKEIGPYAQQAGLDFENMAAAVGVLANSGFRGKQAGTALRNMLLSFTKMSDPALAEIHKLGLRQKDFIAMINEGDLQGAVLKLDKAVEAKGYGAGKKFRAMNTIFQRFTSAKEMTLALKAVRGGDWDTLTAGAKGSRGSSEAVAKRKLKGDAGKRDIAMAKLQQMQVKLGQQILPALLPLGEGLVKSLEKLSNWVEQNPETAQYIAKMAGEFAILGTLAGPAMMVTGSMVKVTGGMISMASKSRAALDELSSAGSAIGEVGKTAGSVAGPASKLRAGIGAAPLWLSAAAAAGSLGYYVGTLADDFTGLSSAISGIDVPTLGEKLFGLNNERTDKRGAGILSKEEQDKIAAEDARLAKLREEKAALDKTSKDDGSFVGKGMSAYDQGFMRKRLVEVQIEQAERRKKGITEASRLRQERENAALAKYQPMITARAQELDQMRNTLNADMDEFRGMKGKVGGRSRRDRAKTSAFAELQRRKATLESENEITQQKVERLGVGLKKGEDFRTKAELKFSPIDVKVSDDRVRVNKDAGNFTLGF